MEPEPTAPNRDVSPPFRGRFSWPQLILWLATAPALGGLAAWTAVIGQFYFAPFLLFPILVGVGLGAMLVGLLRLTHVGNRSTLVAGAVLAVLVAIAGQHYLSFRDARERADRDVETLRKAQQAFPEMLANRVASPPATLLDYLRDQAAQGRPIFRGYKAVGSLAWASWALDALLILIATLTMVVPATRLPYCNRCRSWYRTIRSGRISLATAQELAPLAQVPAGEASLKSARTRLSNCTGGCGPTRLELSWEGAGGRTCLSVAWLDAEGRDRACRALDRAEEPRDLPKGM